MGGPLPGLQAVSTPLNSLSHVTVVWSVIASAALLLGLMQLVRALLDRKWGVDFLFAATAFCFVGVAYTELLSMHAGDAAEWVHWIRWCYLPVTGMIIGLVLFTRQYLGTGRTWLAATVIGFRLLILALNFVHDPTIAFDRVDSLSQVRFLGEVISVVGQAQTSSFQWLGTVATLLLLVYVVDAAFSLWRRGDADQRRRALIIGGAVLLYAGIGGVYVQLVIWRVTTLPLLITPTFAVVVLAMAYELSRDTLRASRLAYELLESRRRLELAAAAADLGLWEWNSRTNRVWTTQQARDIFGFDDAAIHIEEWLARIHPDDLAWIRPATEKTLSVNADHVAEFRVCPAPGVVRWVSAHGRAEYTEGSSGTLMRGVIRDISEQRRAQDETLELRRELTHVGRVSLLGQLASALAHELSQPLGAILRNAEAAELVLGDASPDLEELKAIVADIHRDDRRAGQVIDRLRTLLKRRQMDFQPVAVDALLQDVASLVRGDAVSRQVVIELAVEPGLPAVSGDRVHLSQVLLNLIINGMDAVMELPPASRRVRVEGRHDPAGMVEVTVSDSGPGIPPEAASRIFEPFFTTKEAGMGMGLSVSRTIVDAHGGRIGADTARGGGATFKVSLPALAGSLA
jgi:PAS domain S-box-containing protein